MVTFIKKRRKRTWCWNDSSQDLIHIWSCISWWFLCWLSFGFHVDVPTLSASLAAFQKFTSPEFCLTQHLAPSDSASVALRTCSLEHFRRHSRMEIQNDVRVGYTATTTPGPAQPFLPVNLLLRHTIFVSPALMFSLGWDL